MEQLLARLAELKAEGDAIMQQLMSAGMPPEQIMAAMEGGGQPMPPPDMGGAAMGGMPGPEKKDGKPTRLLLSLRAWGASSKADAKRKAKAISARNKAKKARGKKK